MELFSFPFLFPSFCHPVIYHVVSIVSDDRYQSSFVFFYVVFESLYECVNAVFDAGNTPWEFFPPALDDGLSLEFEWQQVSSSLQDSSQYSDRCKQYCSLNGLDSSSDFQLF